MEKALNRIMGQVAKVLYIVVGDKDQDKVDIIRRGEKEKGNESI